MEDIIFNKQLIPSLLCGLAYFISAVISIESPTSTTYVEKGGRFILVCQVAGLGVHMWYKDGKSIAPNAVNKFHLDQSSPQYSPVEDKYFTTMRLTVEDADIIHTGEYKCNHAGIYSQHVIVVTENMIVTNEDEPGMGKMLTPGEPFILQCSTSECPHCTLLWYKNGEPLHSVKHHLEIFKENNSFVIGSATYNDAGVYMCAIDREGLDIALNATIVVQSKIKLDKMDASSVVYEGSPLELFCEVQGNPIPNIKWFVGNQEIYEGNERIHILEGNRGVKRGKLLIEEADWGDRNYYTCEAFNTVDRVNTTVFVRIKDKLAALWPFLGICAEIAILCSIIFIYERRKGKNSGDEPDTDLPSENKHPRDQIGQKGTKDVRQRK